MLRIENFGKKRNQNCWLFQGIDFELRGGDSVGIIGDSGSGKSSLLKSMIGLLEAHEGQVFWQDTPVTDWQSFRTQVTYLAPSLESSPLSLHEQVRELKAFKSRATLNFEESSLETIALELGLNPELLYRPLTTVSRGELQALQLILGLSMKPKVLLIDEATSAMDKELQLKAEKLIFNYRKRESAATVWISHSEQQIRRVAKTHFRLKHQRLSTV